MIPRETTRAIAVNNKKGHPTKTNKSVKDSLSLKRDDARIRLIIDIINAKPCISTENNIITFINQI